MSGCEPATDAHFGVEAARRDGTGSSRRGQGDHTAKDVSHAGSPFGFRVGLPGLKPGASLDKGALPVRMFAGRVSTAPRPLRDDPRRC